MHSAGQYPAMYTILARRDLLWGIVLIVVGLLVGPGGVSLFG